MDAENTEAHELALTIINDGAQYRARANLAIREHFHKLGAPAYTARLCAAEWLTHAYNGATAYKRQFGSPKASCFTTKDIMQAALELRDYYERHVREMTVEERRGMFAKQG